MSVLSYWFDAHRIYRDISVSFLLLTICISFSVVFYTSPSILSLILFYFLKRTRIGFFVEFLYCISSLHFIDFFSFTFKYYSILMIQSDASYISWDESLRLLVFNFFFFSHICIKNHKFPLNRCCSCIPKIWYFCFLNLFYLKIFQIIIVITLVTYKSFKSLKLLNFQPSRDFLTE